MTPEFRRQEAYQGASSCDTSDGSVTYSTWILLGTRAIFYCTLDFLLVGFDYANQCTVGVASRSGVHF